MSAIKSILVRSSAIHSFSIFIKTQDDEIGDVGASALGNALKKNRTLMILDLRGEDKKETTQMAFTNNLPSLLILSGNKIGERGATSMSDALKTNTTLTELVLCCEDKRKQHTNGIHQQFTLSHSHQINRQQDWRKRGSIIE